MILHTEGFFNIIFGDNRTAFDPREYKTTVPGSSILATHPFVLIQRFMKLDHLIFLNQMHGVNGTTIVSPDQASKIPPFGYEGDFLLTNVPLVGLGIFTADCVPIVIYSPISNAVALAHAGWRGSVGGVAVAALQQMREFFGVDPAQVKIFFGPAARACCYEVQDDVADQLDAFPFKDVVLKKVGTKMFFDVPVFNQLLLQEEGVPKSAFHTAYTICTICNPTFCSFRRQKGPMRQMTVVCLK